MAIKTLKEYVRDAMSQYLKVIKSEMNDAIGEAGDAMTAYDAKDREDKPIKITYYVGGAPTEVGEKHEHSFETDIDPEKIISFQVLITDNDGEVVTQGDLRGGFYFSARLIKRNIKIRLGDGKDALNGEHLVDCNLNITITHVTD